jgi:hypothetical protein
MVALVVGFFYPQLFGILLFFGVMFAARQSYNRLQDKITTQVSQRSETFKPVNTVTGNNSHLSQVNYSQAYSQRKDEVKDTVKDKPLSEAERNVLYGR